MFSLFLPVKFIATLVNNGIYIAGVSSMQSVINSGGYNVFGLDAELGWGGFLLSPSSLLMLKTPEDSKEVF